MRLGKIKAPALPESSGVLTTAFATLIKVLRLYFTRVDDGFNALVGNKGGRFIDNPYGSFYSSASQSISFVNTATPVTLNQTLLSSGISIVSNSRLTFEYSGVYSITVSGNLTSSTAAAKKVWFWINRNGSDIAFSTKDYDIAGVSREERIDWEFVIDVQAGQYIEMEWAADNVDVTLEPVAAVSPRPAVASVLMYAQLVSAPPLS